jgi:hypothetical protein
VWVYKCTSNHLSFLILYDHPSTQNIETHRFRTSSISVFPLKHPVHITHVCMYMWYVLKYGNNKSTALGIDLVICLLKYRKLWCSFRRKKPTSRLVGLDLLPLDRNKKSYTWQETSWMLWLSWWILGLNVGFVSSYFPVKAFLSSHSTG